MKTKTYLLLPLLMLLAACTQNNNVLKALEENIGKDSNYYVLSLKTGNNLTFPIQPVESHVKGLATSGTVLERGVLLTNKPIYLNGSVFFTKCTGCDSCMQCYADAGLLKYNVKSRTETEVIADVELTAKGEKYLLSSINSSVAENGGKEYIRKYDEQGIKLVVENYSTPVKAKVLQKFSDNWYYCEAGTQVHTTPFLTALVGNIDEKNNTAKYAVYYLENTDENGKTSRSVELEKGFYSCGFNERDNYDLEEYKSLENILKTRYNLTDSIMTYHELTADKGKITLKGKEIDTGDSMPDWFSSSIFNADDSGWNKVFFVAGSSYTFDRIVDTYSWRWSDTEDEGANEVWQRENWKMKEVIFKMTRHCSPFDRNINDFDSDKMEWYGRCPYIEIDGTIFFPLQGLWASSKNAVKEGKYGYILRKPQPEESINLPATAFGTVQLKKPFTEIFPATE